MTLSRLVTFIALVFCFVAGYLFETAHHEIAPTWQPGAYIRSCELGGVVESAHSHVARKVNGRLEHKVCHAAETREA